jgi:hypothetical protein
MFVKFRFKMSYKELTSNEFSQNLDREEILTFPTLGKIFLKCTWNILNNISWNMRDDWVLRNILNHISKSQNIWSVQLNETKFNFKPQYRGKFLLKCLELKLSKGEIHSRYWNVFFVLSVKHYSGDKKYTEYGNETGRFSTKLH